MSKLNGFCQSWSIRSLEGEMDHKGCLNGDKVLGLLGFSLTIKEEYYCFFRDNFMKMIKHFPKLGNFEQRIECNFHHHCYIILISLTQYRLNVFSL